MRLHAHHLRIRLKSKEGITSQVAGTQMESSNGGVREFGLVALAVEIIFAIKLLCLAFEHRQVIKNKAQSATAALRAFTLRPQASKCSAEELVRLEEVRQLRVQMIPYYMVCCVVVSQFVLLAARYSATTHGWLQPGSYWTTLALSVVNMAFLFNPRVVSTSTMGFWYVLHMTSCAGYLTPWSVTPAQALNASMAVLACIRLPCILLASRPSLVIGCNLGISILLLARAMTETWALPGCDLFDSLYTLLCGEVMSLILTISMAFLLDGILHQKVRHETRHKSTAAQLGAASSLLNLTCDAIIELDANLRITEDSPQLAAMLLRDRPGSTVKGMTFTQLMPTEHEAARAYQILSSGSAGSAASQTSAGSDEASIHANAFHTRLMDSCSSKFRTEVFQVAYSQVDGQVHHLIGLRDFTDQTPLAGERAMDAMESCTKASTDEFEAPKPFPTWQEVERKGLMTPEPDSSESECEDNNTASTFQATSGDGTVLLYIDMHGVRVASASLTVAHMCGKDLADVFLEKGLEMLRHIWLEASGQQADTIRPFRRIKVRCGKDQYSKISGRVELAKTHAGELYLLVYFKPTRRWIIIEGVLDVW